MYGVERNAVPAWTGFDQVTTLIYSFHLARGLEWCGCRKDEVVLCRTRNGHTHLTRLHILKKDHPPLCEHCQCILTVRHILVECNHFDHESKDIFGRRDVVESFRFHPSLIILLLKQIECYCKF